MDDNNFGWLDANAAPSARAFMAGLGEAPDVWYSVPSDGPPVEIWYVAKAGLLCIRSFDAQPHRMEAELTPWEDVAGIRLKASRVPTEREPAIFVLTITTPELTVSAQMPDQWRRTDPAMPFVEAILARLRSIP